MNLSLRAHINWFVYLSYISPGNFYIYICIFSYKYIYICIHILSLAEKLVRFVFRSGVKVAVVVVLVVVVALVVAIAAVAAAACGGVAPDVNSVVHAVQVSRCCVCVCC